MRGDASRFAAITPPRVDDDDEDDSMSLVAL